MESSTETINSLEVKLRVENNLKNSGALLRIKSPDKFAIIFDDGTIECYFNGLRLWVLVDETREVFYHFTDRENFLLRSPWFSPARIFKNLTRRTLFRLFDVKLIDSFKCHESGHTMHILRFEPKISNVFSRLFEVGHYLMTFSTENYLPVEVVEYCMSGNVRGSITVKKVSINAEIDDSKFEYDVPPGTKMIPLRVVIAERVQTITHNVIDDLRNSASDFRERLFNWSF